MLSGAPQATESKFINGPIRAAGAFSIATALVGMTAWASVIGVRSYMQINTVSSVYVASTNFYELETGRRIRRSNAIPSRGEDAYVLRASASST